MTSQQKNELPNKNRQPSKIEKRPIILTKPASTDGICNVSRSDTIATRSFEQEKESSPNKNSRSLLINDQQRGAKKSLEDTIQSEQHSAAVAPKTFSVGVPERSLRLIDDSRLFCEGISEYLAEFTDFVVIGIVGKQGVGKSTVLNALSGNENIFKTKSIEQHLLAEHTTIGINVWISHERVIYLDCQPLLSPSILSRMFHQEHKINLEFYSAPVTVEIYSLQLLGFLMNVCHNLIIVQDALIDNDLIRLVKTAEMLKPSSPAATLAPSTGDTEAQNSIIEYYPYLTFLHNKVPISEFRPNRLRRMVEYYAKIFGESQLRIRSPALPKDGPVSVVLLPDSRISLPQIKDSSDFDLNMTSASAFDRLRLGFQFDEFILDFRRKIFGCSLDYDHLTTNHKLSEKSWLIFAQKTWDRVKSCPFYMEYSRVIR